VETVIWYRRNSH